MNIDHNNPTFQPFPYNNNRTAWRPIGFPIIMVVPRRKDVTGEPIPNSQVFNVKVLIENVPQEARVAGHDHVGIRYPDKELYAVTINSEDLANRILEMADIDVYRDGVIVDDPQTGDTIHYITRTGTQGTIEYITGANYYDLSDVYVEVETLPSDNYNLIYQAEYFTRVVTLDDRQDLLCIDASSISLAIYRIPIQHPGKVMDEFYRQTPPPYLTNVAKSADSTVALYRPLTDVLQDVADEQLLLESINYVFNTPAEAIPYLSQLLGWELPYFPMSLDNLRKAVLRRTVEFQNLKGSRRAIINIFRLFGFEILISNLWWSNDGEILIRPDESLPPPYEDQEITTVERSQTDVVLSDWSERAFGQFLIPLLYRPQIKATIDDFTALRDGGPVVIQTFLVQRGSTGYTELVAISSELQANPNAEPSIDSRMLGKDILGESHITITGKFGEATAETINFGSVPVTMSSVALDRNSNIFRLTFTGTIDNEQSVFVFALYKWQDLVVPDVITNLQSNRFDLTVVTEDTLEYADPVTLEFSIEFLYKLKAFHSLLRVIRQRIDLNETYEVTDLCVGGDVLQRYNTDIGMLQVPPAIIPDIPGAIDDCTKMDPKSLGYKDDDLLLRSRKLNNLAEELAAWTAYDTRPTITGDTRISPLQPVPGRTAFLYTPYGQDRIIHPDNGGAGSAAQNTWDTEYGPGPNSNQEESGIAHLSPQNVVVNGEFNTTGPDATTNSDSSDYGSFMREYRIVQPPWVTLDDKTDYCYKGRVDDEVLYRLTELNIENVRCRPCNLGLGSGTYYTMPSLSKKAAPGNRNRLSGSMSNKIRFTGRAPEEHLLYYSYGSQGSYLAASYEVPLPKKNNTILGRLYQGYDQPEPETLHFTNRTTTNADQRYQLALQRPELSIEKELLHLPGCRFPRLNALQDDYTNLGMDARPWDDPYSTFCGPRGICGTADPSMLHVRKELRTDGNEYLVFDVVPYAVMGNGLTPDIPSLGDHTLPTTEAPFDADAVIHKIYSHNSQQSPYVELDQLCDLGDTEPLLDVDEWIFSSYRACNTTGYVDFADGYGCVKGYQPYTVDADPLDYVCVNDPTVSCELKTTMLGIPVGSPGTYLILLSSGIQYTKDVRLDCGCLLVGCDETTAPLFTLCNSPTVSAGMDPYYDQDGQLDVECDQLAVYRNMVLNEPIGMCSIRLDGTIPTLMETT